MEGEGKLFTPTYRREELKEYPNTRVGIAVEGKAMPGRHYWVFPLLFSIIFVETGFVLRSFESLSIYLVNGSVYYSPSNYLYFYNSSTGPFSSIFLSNFLFDGWPNLLGFFIYFSIFATAVMFSPNRMKRSWFIVVGSILSGISMMFIIRLLLSPGNMIYGQSGVLAGFAGIAMFYVVLGIVNFVRSNFAETNGRGIFYFFGMCVLLGMGGGEFYGFVAPVLPMIVIQAHVIAFSIGIVLAVIFTLFIEKGEGKGRRERIGASLITEEEGTGGGI